MEIIHSNQTSHIDVHEIKSQTFMSPNVVISTDFTTLSNIFHEFDQSGNPVYFRQTFFNGTDVLINGGDVILNEGVVNAAQLQTRGGNANIFTIFDTLHMRRIFQIPPLEGGNTMCVDGYGNVYVTYNSNIVQYNWKTQTTRTITTQIDDQITKIACSYDGSSLYVSYNFVNLAILDSNGNQLGYLAYDYIDGIAGIAVGKSGNVYVTDSTNVITFTDTATYVVTDVSPRRPLSVALDKNESIYYTDDLSGNTYNVDSLISYTPKYGSILDTGLGVDSNFNVITNDIQNGVFNIFSSDGTLQYTENLTDGYFMSITDKDELFFLIYPSSIYSYQPVISNGGEKIVAGNVFAYGHVGIGTTTPGAALDVVAIGAQALAVSDYNGEPSTYPQTMVNFSRLENDGNAFHLEFVNQANQAPNDYGVGLGFLDGAATPSPFIMSIHNPYNDGVFQLSNTAGDVAVSMAMDGTNFVGVNTAAPTSQLSVQSSPIFNLNLIHNFGGAILKSLISDDGNTVAILDDEHILRLWTKTGGTWDSTIISNDVSYFDMTRDGQNVVYIKTTTEIFIYPSNQYVNDGYAVNSIAFGGTSSVFLSTTSDGPIIFSFDGTNWNGYNLSPGIPFSISASDDGVYAVVSNAYGTYQFSNLSGTWTSTQVSNKNSRSSMSSDGQVICEYTNDNIINIYRNKILEFTFNGNDNGLAHYSPFLSKDGTTFMYQFNNQYNYLYKYQNGQWVSCRPYVQGYDGHSLNYDASKLMVGQELFSVSYSSKAFNVDDSLIVSNGTVGIGTHSNPSAKLSVSGTQPRPPFAPSYYISKHLDNNPYAGMIVSGSGQVAAYMSSGSIVVVRSSNDWQYPESVGVDGSVRSISYDGNTILYVSGGVYYKVTYNGTAWGAPQQIMFGTGNHPIMSSDGSFVAFTNSANVVVSNNYTTFSNIHVPSAQSIAFTDAAKQIAILNSDGTSVSIWDNKNPWTLNNSLTVSGETNISISGDGTVLCVNDNYTSNVFRYNGGSEWTLELTVSGNVGGYISGDGKVFVNDSSPPYNIYYNTNLSTWINILNILKSEDHCISSISSNGQVFLISALSGGANIYSITLPEPVYSQDAIQTSGFSVSSNGLVTASAIHSGGFSVQSAVANTYTEVTIPASGGTSVSYDGHWTAFGNYVSKTVRIYKDGVQFGSTITSSDTYFGAFVSLNRDGTVLAVGGPFGKVYTYTRTQTGWNQSRVIDTGLSIVYKPSLSGDGTRVILGTYYADGLSTGQSDDVSIVYAYNTVSGHLDWSVNFDGNNGKISTAISDDGETVVVAIPDLEFIYVYNYGDTNPVDTIYADQSMWPDPSISTNGNTIVLVSIDQKIYVYNRVG